MNEQPAILAEGVRRTFGDVVALDGLDLRVAPGTVFGLLGPNGAGKTTLVRIVATLLPPSDGRVAVLGHDVVAEPFAVRRRIGLAGQFAAVDADLTGRENVEMIGRLYRLSSREARARAGEVLDRFGLADAADRPRVDVLGRNAPPAGPRREPHRTSARAPARRADDRPDPRTRQELWSTVEELRREGTTVLLTTQYLDEADRLAQRIGLVDRGRIVAEGTASELEAAVGTEILAVRVSEPARTSEAAGTLAELSSGDAPLVDGATGEVRLPVTDPAASAEAVRRLDAAGLPIAAIELQQPSLDDVFLTLTGRRAEAQPLKEAA
jgi:ABC-type multidrug transport system ATPase subunit